MEGKLDVLRHFSRKYSESMIDCCIDLRNVLPSSSFSVDTLEDICAGFEAMFRIWGLCHIFFLYDNNPNQLFELICYLRSHFVIDEKVPHINSNPLSIFMPFWVS